jgi:hypothetical protein
MSFPEVNADIVLRIKENRPGIICQNENAKAVGQIWMELTIPLEVRHLHDKKWNLFIHSDHTKILLEEDAAIKLVASYPADDCVEGEWIHGDGWYCCKYSC